MLRHFGKAGACPSKKMDVRKRPWNRICYIWFIEQGGSAMKKSILDGKRVLGVDDEPDVLAVLEEEILGACPNTRFDKATTYEEAVARLVTGNYDLVILDVVGVRGFELIKFLEDRFIPVALLSTYPLTPEVLNRSLPLSPRVYLPKERMREIVPVLEELLRRGQSPMWRGLLRRWDDTVGKKTGPEPLRRFRWAP